MFSRPVDAGEGFFVQQAGETVFFGDLLERHHDELLVIGREVCEFKDRRDFVLARRHFVVPGFDRNAEFEALPFDFKHARKHALGNDAEVLVIQFLPFRRRGTEQRAPADVEIGAREVEVAIDQEVFLFRTGGRRNEGSIGAEELEHTLRLRVECLHRTKHGRLLIQRFAGPRDECRGNAQGGAVGILEDVSGAGDVPDGIAACFEGLADTAGWERRSVGLTLDQRIALKFRHGAAVAIRIEE